MPLTGARRTVCARVFSAVSRVAWAETTLARADSRSPGSGGCSFTFFASAAEVLPISALWTDCLALASDCTFFCVVERSAAVWVDSWLVSPTIFVPSLVIVLSPEATSFCAVVSALFASCSALCASLSALWSALT